MNIDVSSSDGAPDLVGLLTVIAREAIRLQATSVRINSRNGGVVDFEFQSKPTVSEEISEWLYRAIYESQNGLLPLVAQRLNAYSGTSGTCIDNQLRVFSSKGHEVALEVVD
jgi:hypothetical protein